MITYQHVRLLLQEGLSNPQEEAQRAPSILGGL